tara:strand:- start:185 stop:391 length:207 start_codon:yes stop_codon:yes gene_type:complete
MYSDFLDYGYVESKMQKIYQGHSREITKEVTISTWQSLYKMPRKYFEQFGCILEMKYTYSKQNHLQIL